MKNDFVEYSLFWLLWSPASISFFRDYVLWCNLFITRTSPITHFYFTTFDIFRSFSYIFHEMRKKSLHIILAWCTVVLQFVHKIFKRYKNENEIWKTVVSHKSHFTSTFLSANVVCNFKYKSGFSVNVDVKFNRFNFAGVFFMFKK